MGNHHRKRSQFGSMKKELGLIFDEKETLQIAKKAMKNMFAQKHKLKAQTKQLEQSHLSKMIQQIEELKKELASKNSEISEMKQSMQDLVESKTKLAQNANQCLNQMRQYLILYQTPCTDNDCCQ